MQIQWAVAQMMSLRPSCAELHGFSIRQKATSLILYIMFAECDGPSCMKDNGYLHQEERSRVNAGGCAPRTLLRSNIKDMQRKAGRLDQYTGSSITGSFGPTKAHGISIAPGTWHLPHMYIQAQICQLSRSHSLYTNTWVGFSDQEGTGRVILNIGNLRGLRDKVVDDIESAISGNKCFCELELV
jgi:hypothetical protein